MNRKKHLDPDPFRFARVRAACGYNPNRPIMHKHDDTAGIQANECIFHLTFPYIPREDITSDLVSLAVHTLEVSETPSQILLSLVVPPFTFTFSLRAFTMGTTGSSLTRSNIAGFRRRGCWNGRESSGNRSSETADVGVADIVFFFFFSFEGSDYFVATAIIPAIFPVCASKMFISRSVKLYFSFSRLS